MRREKLKSKEKKIRFESGDGLKLHGTLSTPKHIRGLLLCVHGITSDRDEWGIFKRVAEAAVEKELATLRIDFRGHGESSLEEDQITLAGIVSDVVAAWSELESVGAGSRRLKRFIMGSSFGGGASYAAAGRIGTIDRVFLLAPVFDYLLDIENCAPKWRADLKRKNHFRYNDLKLGRALLNEAFYFDPLAGPKVKTTIFHGTADADVPFELSQAAAARHRHLELVPVEGAGHVLAVPDDLDMEQQASWELVAGMIDDVRRRIR